MFLKKNFFRKKADFLAIVLAVFLFIFLANFPFRTWFSGWDNLHPEFNLSLNLKRSIFAAWQEKGTGFAGGHGYGTNIVHTFLTSLLDIFLPDQYIRPLFTLLMLLLGSLGAFYLTEKLLNSEKKPLSYFASCIASLFYMVSIGTIQNFYAPLESFTIHYAFLPWLLYSLICLLDLPRKRELLLFVFVNLLAIPAGFIPPLFIIYLLFVGIILIWHITSKKSFLAIKKAATIIFLIFSLNAFWFLPVLYYTLAQSNVYLNAYNNLHSTENFVSQNKKYGTLESIALLKGFIFEAVDTSSDGKLINIFEVWLKHFDNPLVLAIAYTYFAIIIFSVFYAVISKRDGYLRVFACLFLITFTFLATNLPPFSFLSEILRNNIPLFKQVFRIAFTKFSIALSLFYAVFLGGGIYFLLRKLEKQKTVRNLVGLFLFFSILIYALPIFEGNLFYQRLKTDIPKEYFDLFEFFRKESPNSRIANTPAGWNWGWSIYSWGYSGSGFLWYGLPQPILDRAFDVWSSQNENYYWELSYALYSESFDLFERILDKYQIEWVVFDRTVIPYPNTQGFRYSHKLEEFLQSSRKVTLVKTFTNLTVYKVNSERQVKDFVFVTSEINSIGPTFSWNNFDQAYLDLGDYISSLQPNIYYPFRYLFSRLPEEKEFKVEEKESYFVFSSKIPESFTQEKFVLANDLDEVYDSPRLFIDKENLSVFILKQNGLYTYNSKDDPNFKNHQATNCGIQKAGTFSQKVINYNGVEFLRFSSKEADTCYDIALPEFLQRFGYLLIIESRNLSGEPLKFALINQDSNKADLETRLIKSLNFEKNFLVIPPMKKDAFGYNLHFQNTSAGQEKTINDIASIRIYPLPYHFLTNLKITRGRSLSGSSEQPKIEVSHPNPSYYAISIKYQEARSKNTLVLSQSFDRDWKAYQVDGKLAELFPFIFGKELKDHVLVNNWQNGWMLPTTHNQQSTTIVIFYLPQLLEYFGFLLLGSGVVWVLRRKIKL